MHRRDLQMHQQNIQVAAPQPAYTYLPLPSFDQYVDGKGRCVCGFFTHVRYSRDIAP